MKPPLDLRLNAIVDPERAGGCDLVDLARRVVAGGATLVQLRDKKSDTRRMIELACADVKQALVEVMPLLGEEGVALTGIETEEPNLERVFLHLTGRALRD